MDRCLQTDRGKDIKKRTIGRCLQTDRGKNMYKEKDDRQMLTDRQTGRQTEGKIQRK
jgi:hypothetical protein